LKDGVNWHNLLSVVSMLFVIQCSLIMPHGIVNAQNEEYHNVLTLESPNPVENAWFGARVKINGEIVAISERYSDVDDVLDAGLVFIYDTDGNLKFTLQSPLPQASGGFGWTLDIFNDTIVISEPGYIVEDIKNVGKAHIFTIDGTYKLSLQPPEVISGNNFGLGIGGHDDVIVIAELSSEGKVHLFDNEGTYLKTLYSPKPIATGKFGQTIEVSETLILIGEHGTGGNPRGPGSVYMFDHDGNHLMTLQAPEPEDQARFGVSISISGGLMVIGESYATVDEVFRAGKVYIFNTDGEHLQTLESPNPKMNGQFGDDVAIDGDRVVVGEGFADVNPLRYEGRAYVFDIDGNLLQNLTAPQPCLRGAFGLGVDIEGDTIVISEAWAAIEDLGQAGRAHIFRLGEAIFELSNLVIEPESVNVGESVTVSVDVANVGTLSGTYSVKLMMGGDMLEEKTVTVDIGASEKVVFTHKTEVEGTHRVEIDELEDSFNVAKPPIPGFSAIALTLGLVFTIIFIAQRKRYPPFLR
jgi:hypothetical protein